MPTELLIVLGVLFVASRRRDTRASADPVGEVEDGELVDDEELTSDAVIGRYIRMTTGGREVCWDTWTSSPVDPGHCADLLRSGEGEGGWTL